MGEGGKTVLVSMNVVSLRERQIPNNCLSGNIFVVSAREGCSLYAVC